MKFSVDAKKLQTLKRQAMTAKRKLEDRTKLHESFRIYQGTRWLENLYNGGQYYGSFAWMRAVTRRLRIARGLSAGPVMIGGNRLRPKQMSVWMLSRMRSAQVTESTTKFDFRFSGNSDGSYAVLHDQGYIAGGMFAGKNVPQRKLFWINDEDERELLERTGKFADEALKGLKGVKK